MKKVIQNFCNYSRYERELEYIQPCKYCFGVLKKYEKQLEALQDIYTEHL